MARIDKATVDKVLDVTKIEEVVSDFVSLKNEVRAISGFVRFIMNVLRRFPYLPRVAFSSASVAVRPAMLSAS